MSETLPGKEDGEKKIHWCPTYRSLQQKLAAAEKEGAETVRVNYSQEHAPEVWEGRTGYPAEEIVPSLKVRLAKRTLYQHRISCHACVEHFPRIYEWPKIW